MDIFYFQHQWKALLRDKGNERGLVILIIGLLLLQIVLLLWRQLPDYQEWLFQQTLDEKHAYWVAVHFILFLDLFLKWLTKSVALNLKPYKTLPVIPGRLILGYLLFSLTKFWNLIILMVSLPFLVFLYQWDSRFLGPFLIYFFFTHYIVHWWYLSNSRGRIVAMLLLQGVLFSVLFWPVWYFRFHDFIYNLPIMLMLLVLSIYGSYQAGIRQYHRYRNEEGQRKSWFQWEFNISFFKDPLAQLEWALLFRSKRARSNMIAGIVSVLFIIVFGRTQVLEDNILRWMVSIIITGMIMIQHGIYTLGWEGNYFELLITRMSFRQFLRFKYKFFMVASLMGAFLGMFLVIFDASFFLYLLVALLYNLGINLPLILWASLNNKQKLNLDQSTVMNYQGFNGTVMLMSFVTLLLPLLMGSLLASNFGEWIGLGILGVLGLIGVLFKNAILEFIEKKYQQKKYELADAYRT
jgi:hypothetical protein